MAEAPNRVPTWAILTVLAAISCGAYFNTIQAGFTYDDFFAVVRHFDYNLNSETFLNCVV